MGKSMYRTVHFVGLIAWLFIVLAGNLVWFVSGKRNKGGRGSGGADDQLDGGSDADSVASMSTALSDLQLAQATEHVSSQEFVLDKYIDELYEKR
jgi:hypothetical protein